MEISKSYLDLIDQLMTIVLSNNGKVFSLLFIKMDDDSKRELSHGS